MADSVPVTDYALVNALGDTTETVLDALENGRSGVGPCPIELPFAALTGAVRSSLPLLPAAHRGSDSRTARLAAAALAPLLPAIARATARHGAHRVGLVLGTTTAGLERTESAYHQLHTTGALPADYNLHEQHSFGGLLEVLRAIAGVTGPTFAVSTACSASAKAFGTAERLLAHDRVDAMVVGGVDSLCLTTLCGFQSLEILSDSPCRPFSEQRRGTNLGEGAAFLLLDRRGDARAFLLGVGESSDAHQMSAPHPEGRGALAAMREALARAGKHVEEIAHINAHSPGTKLNDVSEGLAVRSLWGTRIPVASTKGYTGHLLGACGATEAAFSIASLERGFIPASVGSSPVDASLGIDVATERRPFRGRTVLSNSFAFGGSNVSLLFGSASS